MQTQTLTPEFLKKYDISEVINHFDTGGQKIVYIVKDSKGRKVAIKFFRNCSKRDLQEIAILERFKSVPGIAKIIKTEEHGGAPIVFEECIDAPDLDDIQAQYQGDALKVGILVKNIAEILRPIWNEGIVHRDLKPKNIKILPDGKPIILDFGIARDLTAKESITDTGDNQPMTWFYATPEQFAKDKDSISYRTDFFALGIIAYTLYHKQHPFGTLRDEIHQKFLTKDNTLTLTEGNPLNNFFEANLVIEPSGRPRNVDIFLSTL